jgi:hypothetical protein
MKSVIGVACAHTGSSSRPSTSIEELARTAVARGASSWR